MKLEGSTNNDNELEFFDDKTVSEMSSDYQYRFEIEIICFHFIYLQRYVDLCHIKLSKR